MHTATNSEPGTSDEPAAPVPRRRHTTRIVTAAALTTAVGIGLIACAQGGAGAPAPDVRVHNAVADRGERAVTPLKPSEPTGLRIPSAGVDATSMLGLAVGADRELDVPPVDRADEPGWWTGGVTPGEKGPAVIVAHYDTANGPALMKDVAKVGVGDTVEVPRADGGTAVFAVREIQQVDKKDFPTNKVYGATDRPELRLLTCGGPLVDGHRSDNIILYADLVS